MASVQGYDLLLFLYFFAEQRQKQFAPGFICLGCKLLTVVRNILVLYKPGPFLSIVALRIGHRTTPLFLLTV